MLQDELVPEARRALPYPTQPRQAAKWFQKFTLARLFQQPRYGPVGCRSVALGARVQRGLGQLSKQASEANRFTLQSLCKRPGGKLTLQGYRNTQFSILIATQDTRFTRIILQKPWILSFSATVKWQNLSQRRAFSWDTFCRGDSVLPPPTYSLFQINSSEHFCAGQNGIKSISLSQMALENTFFSTISLSPT